MTAAKRKPPEDPHPGKIALIPQERVPGFPYVRKVDRRGLPTHIRYSKAVEKYQGEFCPHAEGWGHLPSARTSVPPCVLFIAKQQTTGCPNGKERECCLYVMGRINGRTQEKAFAFQVEDLAGKNDRSKMPETAISYTQEGKDVQENV